MLLSSVNFVAKPKAAKNKDKSEKKVANKSVLSKQSSQESDVCDECKKEVRINYFILFNANIV